MEGKKLIRAQKVAAKDDTIEIPVGKYMESLRENPWKISTFVLVLVLLGVAFFNPFDSTSIVTGKVVDGDKAGQNAVNFINANPTLDGEVSLLSVTEQEGFYAAILEYQGQQVPIYLTLDGEYLLTGQPVPLNSNIPTIPSNNAPPPTTAVSEVSSDGDPFIGDANAPVTIIEFSDYRCPFCQKFWAETLPQIKKNYIDTGKVKLVYRDYPLPSHVFAHEAAQAAECVRAQSDDAVYFEYHDKLFANPGGINIQNLKTMAEEMGYDISTCLDSGEFEAEVTKDFSDGSIAGVSGTPSFFVNGKPISGAQPYAVFEQLIESELVE
jgi:protein-disulfide isomerase